MLQTQITWLEEFLSVTTAGATQSLNVQTSSTPSSMQATQRILIARSASHSVE